MRRTAVAFLILVAPSFLRAQVPFDSAQRARECPRCAGWMLPQKPFRIFGNTYYVGTRGLSSILVTSPGGHVVIDGTLPEAAPVILSNIRALGFRVEDVKLILNSHAHYDHAGGIEALRAATGAAVAASPWSAGVIEAGKSGPSDPQFGILIGFPPVPGIRRISDGEVLKVGDLALTAHFTGGHTPGGTSWTWTACEGSRCLDIVYADSQTPGAADGFFFSHSTSYPSAIADFEHSFGVLEHASCDILVTPHPDASNLFERATARDSGDASKLVDREACRRYAADARRTLAHRLDREKSGAGGR